MIASRHPHTGRASLAYVMLRAGGVHVEFVDDDELAAPGGYKAAAPFGQLPYLVDARHSVTLAQSSAVVAYAARITGLDGGAHLPTYANTLQYIELEAELTGFLGKALYTGADGSEARTAAWADAKAKIDTKLARVVANLGDKSFFAGAGAAGPSGADYAVAAITWLMSLPSLWPEVRREYPALDAHFARVAAANPAAAACFAEMSAWTPYYKRS